MTHLGIVISVSNYSGTLKPLPGCINDGQSITSILRNEERFDEILIIDSDTTRKAVMDKILNFIEKYNNQNIDELFFYFSGHGNYKDDEFYYLLTDSDLSRLKSTAILNSEIDDLARSAKPSLFVKVVDACYSGMNYIKSEESLASYLSNKKGSFDRLYFMFSSQQNQRSFQDGKLSDFTRSIISSIVKIGADNIRYKEVINSVSDDFDEYDNQEPLFITQGNNKDIFCTPTDDLISKLNKLLDIDTDSKILDLDVKASTDLSLVEIIKKDSNRYCSKEEAVDAIVAIASLIKEARLSPMLSELFDLSVDTSGIDPSISTKAIGDWIDANKTEPKFLAKAIFGQKIVKKRVPKDILTWRRIGSLNDIDFDWVDETQSHIVGFESTTELPYKFINAKLEPKYSNLQLYTISVAPIISQMSVRIFFSNSAFEITDWAKWTLASSTAWHSVDAPLKDSARIKELISQYWDGFLEYVEGPIRAKFSLTNQGD